MSMTRNTPTTDFKVVAIISAHNEADIIAPVIGHLIGDLKCTYSIMHRPTTRRGLPRRS